VTPQGLPLLHSALGLAVVGGLQGRALRVPSVLREMSMLAYLEGAVGAAGDEHAGLPSRVPSVLR